MLRAVLVLALVGCGRAQGISDQDLGGLVITPKPKTDPIDVGRATRDAGELGRAIALPERAIAAALGPHVMTIATTTTVSEAGKTVEELSDRVAIELGDQGTYHALYTNSADYGREVTWQGGKLYLRPRYQRWHERAPETPDEPDRLRDELCEAIAATWELVAPAAEVNDLGVAQAAGRPGRKIAIQLAPEVKQVPAEALVQRKWREQRTIDELYGEAVLDADKGVPLAVKLAATISFTRDHRHFTMKVSLDAAASSIGQATAIAAPGADDVVATPERLREVDDRDFLLQGIAPPLRKAPEGGSR
ncbi:MAG TPA: hypothetical protein VMJ10_31600 [Kofleriaceae bacterium]|nr:hypothetical protein [Kofleriaceae bacterium]